MYDTTTTILPNRPIYNMAQTYERVFPEVSALASMAYTPGNRVDKAKAGAGTFVNMYTYQHINRWYARKLKQFEMRHPRFYEQMNRHPFLLGIPVTGIGIALAWLGGDVSEGALGLFLGMSSINKGLKKFLHTEPMDKIAKLLKPVERFANKGIVKFGLLFAGLGFLGALIGRSIQDHWNFSKHYAEARKEQPYGEISPYQLRTQVAQDLWMPRNPKADLENAEDDD